MMLELKEEKYQVQFHPQTGILNFSGSFMLAGVDGYKPILELCHRAAESAEGHLTLDLRNLKFLNSSGINMMAKFVVNLRNDSALKLTIHGTNSLVWQTKLVKNLQRLMPEMTATME